jgi:hypothetical protein
MSLPAGQRNWICCPYCGEIEDIWRQGKAGVPESRYGSRTRSPDSNTFKCNFCGRMFVSDGASRREVMGYNVSGRDVTAFD